MRLGARAAGNMVSSDASSNRQISAWCAPAGTGRTVNASKGNALSTLTQGVP